MNIPTYISDLLHEHNCVIVPELGGFLVDEKSAKFSPTTQQILAPTSQVAFNKNLSKNDGLLYNYLMEQERIDYSTAQQKVKQFVAESKHFLDQNKSFMVPQVGKLFLDEEDNLQFAPDKSVNYSSTHFGLPNVTAQPVVRETKISIEQKAITVEQTGTKKKTRIPLYAAAASLALLFTFGALLTFFGGNSSNQLVASTSASLKSAFGVENKTVVAKELNAPEIESVNYLPIHSAKPVFSLPAEKDITPEPNYKFGERYHIVIGIFKEQANAKKMADKAVSLGYSPIVKKGRKFHRVVLPYSKSEGSVRSKLLEVKSALEPGAWVWETRNR